MKVMSIDMKSNNQC